MAAIIAILLCLPTDVKATSPEGYDDAVITINVVSLVDVSCFGLSTGAVTVLATGGVPLYTYVWSNGMVGPVSLALSAGVYTVTCTDLVGATATLDVTIDEPDELDVLVLSQVNIDCNNATGSVTVGTTGGTGLSIYLWSNGNIGPVATDITAGVYIVTATDDNGCISIESITVTADLTLPAVNASVNAEITCLNANVTLDGTGSALGANILYLWTTVDGHIVSGSNTLNNCVVDEPGTYVLLVTNLLNGCDDSDDVTVTANVTLPAVNATVNAEITCLNATVTLDGTGSAVGPNILYLWTTVDGHILSGANTLNNCVVDEPGTYVLLVTNLLNGCDDSDGVTVTANITMPAVSASVNAEINCLNANVTLDGTGSALGANILYLWTTVDGHIVSGANTLNNCVVDEPGTYVLLVTNLLNGCSDSDDVTVTANITLPAVNASVNAEINCLNANVTLDGTGSALGANILYLWTTVDGHIVSGANTLNNCVVDEPGTYVLLVTNLLNGCSASDDVTVTVDLELPIVDIAIAAQLDCQNSTVILNATGSTPSTGIVYLWATVDGNIVSGANTATPTVNAAGTYTLTITISASGCTATGSVIVTGTPSVMVSVQTLDDVDCFGGANGSVTVVATGGVAPFTYLWSNGMTTASISGLAAGSYTATITDAAGCVAVVLINIGQPAAQLAASATATAVTSNGAQDGSITLTVNGGTPLYTYLWSNGMTTANVTGLAAGTFSVTITDANGCTIEVDVTVPDFDGCLLGVSLSAQNTACGQNTGSATATVSNPIGAATYLWSNGMTTASISGLAAGTYSVTVQDGNGCEATGSIVVGVAADATPPTAIAQNITVAVDSSGTAAITAAMVNNGSSDLCGSITISINVDSFDCGDLGTNPIVLTVTDQSGNTATAIAMRDRGGQHSASFRLSRKYHGDRF
ncbi:MAG: SprB repeat-containing protein [Saprospiraceae bacterium]|nr:SprB repeat-containing protein [Saprospiraceae bacterium]